MAQRDAVQWGVRYENSRGEVKERFFDTKHGMQGWLSTVGDQVKLLALSIYRVPETSDRDNVEEYYLERVSSRGPERRER